MKTKILLVFLLGLLATTGSTCIQDGFVVAVNLPLDLCVSINQGNDPSFAGSQTVYLKDQIDAAYLDKIKEARYYDVQVQVKGDFSGNIYNGKCYVDNKKLLDFAGTWDSFKTSQSLLGGSTLIKTDTTGLNALLNALVRFKTQPSTSVVLSGEGVLGGQVTIPSGLSVCLKILAQVDAEVNND